MIRTGRLYARLHKVGRVPSVVYRMTPPRVGVVRVMSVGPAMAPAAGVATGIAATRDRRMS